MARSIRPDQHGDAYARICYAANRPLCDGVYRVIGTGTGRYFLDCGFDPIQSHFGGNLDWGVEGDDVQE